MLEPLDVTRVVAAASVVDGLVSQDGIMLRIAPDEALVIGGLLGQPPTEALIIADTGWSGTWLTTTATERFLATSCAWTPPNDTPVFAQGMAAGLPVHCWFETDRTLVVTRHVFAQDLAIRMQAVCDE